MDEESLSRNRARRASQRYESTVLPVERSRQCTVPVRRSVYVHHSSSFEVWKEMEPTFRPLINSLSSATIREHDSSGEVQSRLPDRPGLMQIRSLKRSVIFMERRQELSKAGTILELKTLESTVSTAYSQVAEEAIKAMLVLRTRTPFEAVDLYQDRFWGLEIRKAILRMWEAYRQICRLITKNSLFQTFIILLILINTVLLALEDPSIDVQPEPYHSMEKTLLYIYTAEMGLKICAMGFVLGKGTYIRDPWNILDFVVVVSGWIEIESNSSGINLSALRALRILRPLRSITRIEGMKIVFLSLMSSVRMLLSSITLLIFFYCITSIGFLQMFMGVLKTRCMSLDTGYIASSWDDSTICGSRSCGLGEICVKGLDNPNYGKSHFDNLMISMLAIFQSVTLEGWTPIMNALEKSVGMFIVIFYVPVVFMGAFFFMNMTLVAMKSSVTST